MIALTLEWGGDLLVGPGGDIGVASIGGEIQQRIIRRLLTNAGDYIWHPTYGAGLGKYVGQPYSPRFIESTVLNNLRFEPSIAPSPSPSVETSISPDASLATTSVRIKYRIAGTPAANSVVIDLGSRP